MIDHLTYSAGAEAVVKVEGTANSNIVITNTDLKPAAKDFLLANGATTDALRVK